MLSKDICKSTPVLRRILMHSRMRAAAATAMRAGMHYASCRCSCSRRRRLHPRAGLFTCCILKYARQHVSFVLSFLSLVVQPQIPPAFPCRLIQGPSNNSALLMKYDVAWITI